MAFNKAPSQSTYQTRDVKLIGTVDNRNKTANTDMYALNGFYDIINDKVAGDKEYHFVKRDGLAAYPHVPIGSTIRGVHFWEEEDKLLIAYDTKLDIVRASTGVLLLTVNGAFFAGTTEVGFTNFQYASGEVKVVYSDGSDLYTIDTSNVITATTSPDFPTPISPHPVYLDGYVFVVKAGTADIYNSNLDDPLAWTAGDFIAAEMLPDDLIRIARLRNYIAAFGTGSIEYFYDAANESGSPLNRNDTPLKQVGFLGGMAFYDSKIYFVGKTSTTDPEVMVVEDFKLDRMNSPPLRRYIQPHTTFEGAVVSMGGSDFYILNVGVVTFMVDLETGLWTRLAFGNTTTFPIKYAVNFVRAAVGNTSLVLFDNTMEMFNFNPDLYQDSGVNFSVEIQLDPTTFDTMHEKYMSRLIFNGDYPLSPSNLMVSWTDDDYQTWTTPRALSLRQDLPAIQRLGRFRKRAFRLTFNSNIPMRMQNLEVDFNIGGR